MTPDAGEQAIAVVAWIKREQDDLPRYAIVSGAALASWSLATTTTVEIAINARQMKRRSIMRLDQEDWFVTITEADCRALAFDTGDEVRLTLQRASTALPPELAQLLSQEPAALAKWRTMSASQQRQLREYVAEAKQSATRKRRARMALLAAP